MLRKLVLGSTCTMPPLTYMTHALGGASSAALDVADQKRTEVWALKGWPIGRDRPGEGIEGSIKLANSMIDGSRQPWRLPTALLAQVRRASFQLLMSSRNEEGDCSQTSPVSRSKTASLLKSANTANRLAVGMMLLQAFRRGCFASSMKSSAIAAMGPARNERANIARGPRAWINRLLLFFMMASYRWGVLLATPGARLFQNSKLLWTGTFLVTHFFVVLINHDRGSLPCLLGRHLAKGQAFRHTDTEKDICDRPMRIGPCSSRTPTKDVWRTA